MNDNRRIEIVRLADLRADTIYDRWEGGAEIGRMAAPRREAFLANPLRHGDDDPAQVIVTLDGRAVARFDMFLGEVFVAGQPVPMLWGSDLFVDPGFRNRGLGMTVSKGLQDVHPVAAVCGVSARSRPIFRKLQWTDFHLQRHLVIRRSRPVIEKYLPFKPLVSAASILTDLAMAGQRSLLRSRRSQQSQGLTVERVAAAPESLDARFTPHDYRVSPHRSVAWLNWLLTHTFEDDADQKTDLFLVKEGSGAVIAYFLTKSRFHEEASQHEIKNVTIGSLLDWRIFDEDRVDLFDITMYAVDALIAGGVDVVEICMHDDSVSRRLTQFGVPNVGSLNLMFTAAPDSPLHARECHLPDAWRLRPADGDNAFT